MCAQDRSVNINVRDVITKLRMVKLILLYPTHNLKPIYVIKIIHKPRIDEHAKGQGKNRRDITQKVSSWVEVGATNL